MYMTIHMIVFEAQHDGTGTAAMNHSAFDYVGTEWKTLAVYQKAEIDTSTSGTSGGFKQSGISKDPENSDTSAANANAYVVFNTGEHVYQLNNWRIGGFKLWLLIDHNLRKSWNLV